MYSVVLATMFNLNASTPEFGWIRNNSSGCHGCSGCWGGIGCYGGCSGSFSMSSMMPMPAADCGCSQGFGPAPIQPMPMLDTMPLIGGMAAPPTGPFGEGIPPGAPPAGLGETRTSQSQVLFVVTLPADARLLADGTVIPGSGPVRLFQSPKLDPAREYFYELVIEVDRNGKTLRDQQTVKFQAGKTANVSFMEPKAESTSPPASPMPKTSNRIASIRG